MLDSRHLKRRTGGRGRSTTIQRIQRRRTRQACSAELTQQVQEFLAGVCVRFALRKASGSSRRSAVRGFGLTQALIDGPVRAHGHAWPLGVADSVSRRNLLLILAAQGMFGINELAYHNRQRRRNPRSQLRVVGVDFNPGEDADDRLRRLFHTLLGPNGAIQDEDAF